MNVMWIAALVLVGLFTFVGYRQGATRATFVFIAVVVAACLALPLGPLLAPVFGLLGFKNPLYPEFVGPIIVFVVISLLVQSIGQFVHRKIDYHYRYHR